MKHLIIQFIIMFLLGIFLNPMNILAYNINHLYISLTLIYGGLLMASNMIWSHEIINYISHNKFNLTIFLTGLIISVLISIFLLRKQFAVNDNEWLKRMISHHSTALTTSEIIKNKTLNNDIKLLANNIIKIQKKEIQEMKDLIK